MRVEGRITGHEQGVIMPTYEQSIEAGCNRSIAFSRTPGDGIRWHEPVRNSDPRAVDSLRSSPGLQRKRTSFLLIPLLVVAAACPLEAAQSLVITPTVNVTAAASSGPIGSATTLRVEGRITGYTSAPSINWLVLGQDNGWYINVITGGSLAVDERKDTFPGGDGNVGVSLSGRSDFLFRIQRDVSNKRVTVEIWDTTTGSNRAYSTKTWTTTNSGWTTSQLAIYTPGTGTSYMAWLRVYDTVLALDSAVPRDSVSSAAPIADWRFEGNLTDSSANGYNFSGTGATYSTTPVLSPSCGVLVAQSYRAGTLATLNGSSRSQALDGTATLTSFWTTLAGPYPEIWTSRTAADGTVTFPSFGQWTAQLSVADSSGNKSTCTSVVGAVGTDDNGVVVDAPSYVYKILGPQIRWGASPWPSFDERNKAYADLHGAAQGVVLIPYWETAEAGTVTATNGSSTITGSGTSFQSTFCNGGSTPASGTNPQITLWYRVGAATGRRGYAVTACGSDTSLTIYGTYLQPTADSSAVQYSASSDVATGFTGPNPGQAGLWSGNASNANFYDNVLAYYSFYYRTGLTAYRDYARWLAAKWWRSPLLDEGRVCVDGFGGQCNHPRNRGIVGMMFYALESGTDIWSELDGLFDYDIAHLASTRSLAFSLIDVRERGYMVMWLSLCAGLALDGAQRAECDAAVDAEHTYWEANQESGGNFISRANGTESWNGYPGTASATNGSTTVTGSGTSWGIAAGSANVWFAACDGMSGDARAYDYSAISATSITLTEPYEGTTGSGKCFQFNNITGFNTSPFIIGIPGFAWYYAYREVSSGYIAITHGVADWISTQGVRVAERGLKYDVGSPSCYTPAMDAEWCQPGDYNEARTLSGEGLNPLIFSYLADQSNTSLKSATDNLFSALWGREGGPDSDGTYVGALYTTYYSNTVAKWLGFFFGIGRGPSWPAVRLGGQAAEDLRTYTFGFKLPTGADRIALEVRRPSGEVVIPSTCTTSPCSLTYDARLGPHSVRYNYETTGGVVKGQSEWRPIR